MILNIYIYIYIYIYYIYDVIGSIDGPTNESVNFLVE